MHFKMCFHKTNKRFSAVLILLAVCILFSSNASALDNTQAKIYRYYRNDEMKIALTFDDGPHPKYTYEILDILDEYGIKATFFVAGINVLNYPDTFKEIINRGHEIANHTYTHANVEKLNHEELKREIELCQTEIFELSNYNTNLFRPPEGKVNPNVQNVCTELDYNIILWDIDTKDWANNPPNNIAKYVTQNVTSGDIILMHDYISYNSPTPKALKTFIPVLLSKGYNFVVVGELINE